MQKRPRVSQKCLRITPDYSIAGDAEQMPGRAAGAKRACARITQNGLDDVQSPHAVRSCWSCFSHVAAARSAPFPTQGRSMTQSIHRPTPTPLALTVILPTYNERENVPVLIADILRTVREPVRVMVVDDNSPDGTWQVVERLAGEDERVRLLRRVDERGLTSAIQAGIRAADTEAVSWMDVDLAMPAHVIPQLLARLEAGADIAVGSRYVRGGSDPGHSPMAQAFSRVINAFAALLLRAGVRDYTSGFIAARRTVFDRIELR